MGNLGIDMREASQAEQMSDRLRSKELARVKRALSMLTRATDALMHASDEQQLLNDICRILVEEGDYLCSWIGYVQHDDEKSIWPVARFGVENALAIKTRVSWDENKPFGQGPSGAAVRTGKPQMVRGPQISEMAKFVGSGPIPFKAALSLPLVVEDRPIGVLSLYSIDDDAFDSEEIRLIENLSRNVAFGIGTQRMQFDRRRAERELKESEGRYRVLVELAPDAILVHTQGIIIFSNSAADQLFRAAPGRSLMGKRIIDLVDPQEDPPALLGLDNEEAHCSAVEERLVRLDGTVFEAEVTFAPIVFHGVHARQVFIRDVTDRKQVHGQLVQTAKLATLGEMAAGMAHELSQPINIMRMAAEGALLLIGRQKATQEYQVKQFTLIAAQASRMAEIIDHIRIFSRKDTGEVVVFDACGALQLAIDLMEPQMSSNDVDICVTLPDHPCPVRGRPVQLEQVVINLLSNAADAVKEMRLRSGEPRRGQVKMEAQVQPGGKLAVTVTDNGPGIAKEDIDRVFEPFFTTKEVGSGTGLGLSVSFGIISAMGGRLSVSSTGSTGAQFVITVPLAEGEAIEGLGEVAIHQPEDQANQAASSARHLLLVDDEKQAIETMSTYFSELGYRISQAHSGNAAFRLFENDPADLVVTDIRMPDGDGEQLVKKLRRVAPGLPIVVVTGHIGATEEFTDDPDSHATAILKKPISLAQMAETVEKMLQPY